MEAQNQCPACGVAGPEPMRCGACGVSLQVADEYALGELLAQGNNGRIHAGVRLADGHPVAIKLLGLSDCKDWKTYQLFERGSELLQSLSHPGLPKVYATARDSSGNLYQVRERFEGGTLRDRVERLGAIPSAAVVRKMLVALLRTLQYLHGRVPPVIHRDIKPSNVMFRSSDSWEPVLIDFESLAQAQASTGTTIVVTPGYTAPEQLAGHTSPQSDLYSLAATFVYVCTGREPAELLRSDPSPAALFGALDERAEQVLTGMLAPIPAQRIKSASEALRLLDAPPAALARALEPSPVVRAGKRTFVVALATLAIAVSIPIAGAERLRRLSDGVIGLGLDLNRVSERVFVQSVKGIAADVGVGVRDCAVRRHVLRGDDYASLMNQLEAIEGLDHKGIVPVHNDTFVVLRCDTTPYPLIPLFTKELRLTLRSAHGVPTH